MKRNASRPPRGAGPRRACGSHPRRSSSGRRASRRDGFREMRELRRHWSRRSCAPTSRRARMCIRGRRCRWDRGCQWSASDQSTPRGRTQGPRRRAIACAREAPRASPTRRRLPGSAPPRSRFACARCHRLARDSRTWRRHRWRGREGWRAWSPQRATVRSRPPIPAPKRAPRRPAAAQQKAHQCVACRTFTQGCGAVNSSQLSSTGYGTWHFPLRLSELLNPGRIRVPLLAQSKEGVLRELVDMLVGGNGRSGGSGGASEDVLHAVLERERQFPTGIGYGVAVPHGKTPALANLIVVAGTTPAPVPYETVDGEPVRLFFMLAGPESQAGAHVKALSRISRLVRREPIRARLLSARSADEFYQVLLDAEKIGGGGGA